MIKKIDDLTVEEIAGICDHTFLHTLEYFKGQGAEDPIEEHTKEFEKFLEQTMELPFMPYAVCVRPEKVAETISYLEGSEKENLVIAAVAGFPNGADYSPIAKLNWAREALNSGAGEIDFVMNYDALKNGGDIFSVNREFAMFDQIKAEHPGTLTKVILETSELTGSQIVQACTIAENYQIDFVKTSTGYSSGGAKAEDLQVMRNNFAGGIKISGGVNSKNLQELLYAASGRSDGMIDLDPVKIRIGESSLLKGLIGQEGAETY